MYCNYNTADFLSHRVCVLNQGDIEGVFDLSSENTSDVCMIRALVYVVELGFSRKNAGYMQFCWSKTTCGQTGTGDGLMHPLQGTGDVNHTGS